VLKARAVMVGIIVVSFFVGKLTGSSFLMILVVPDLIVTLQVGEIYDSLKAAASVGGNTDVNAARSFLNSFVGAQFLAMAWGAVFAILAVLVMIVLRVKLRRGGRVGGVCNRIVTSGSQSS
jgi:ribose/xylose/arabinose/galactoside ABC-type transport system permease subunit